MEVFDAIRRRKSVRGYTGQPVPRELLLEILDAACRAPSAMNTQPWEFYVLGGKVLDMVREANVERLRAGVFPNPEHPPVGWPREGVYRDRQVELAKGLFSLMGIAREDHARRQDWTERGFRFFGAPAAIIVCAKKVLAEGGPLLDLGCAIQTLCLAATARGLGTCVEDQGVMYPDTLREHAGIPEDTRILMAVAIGYPDPDFPANAIETSREPASRVTTFAGFD
jgi:nitroreductase